MSEWTIAELAGRVAKALGDEVRQSSGRVTDVPDGRLIRWYATIGLLDPPRRQGRQALYGPRHLAQLVAIKHRQAEGRSLAEIQAELVGATDETLQAIAQTPTAAAAALDGSPAPSQQPRDWVGSGQARATFWSQHAARLAQQAADPGPRAPAPPVGYAVHPVPAADLVTAIRLAPGVTVVLDAPRRTATGDDLAAIRAASNPLLETLAERGLHRPDANRGGSA